MTAEQAYVEARDGFVGLGIGYEAALVSLDLAVLYLRRGRTGSMRRVAKEMIPGLPEAARMAGGRG